MSDRFDRFITKRDFTLKSLREVEHFLKNFTVVRKGKKVYDIFRR